MHIQPPTRDLIFQLCLIGTLSVIQIHTTYVLQYFYDNFFIVINNIYMVYKKSVSLKPIILCLDAANGRPVCNRKLVISYTYLL